jgi:hypothetical protein
LWLALKSLRRDQPRSHPSLGEAEPPLPSETSSTPRTALPPQHGLAQALAHPLKARVLRRFHVGDKTLETGETLDRLPCIRDGIERAIRSLVDRLS